MSSEKKKKKKRLILTTKHPKKIKPKKPPAFSRDLNITDNGKKKVNL